MISRKALLPPPGLSSLRSPSTNSVSDEDGQRGEEAATIKVHLYFMKFLEYVGTRNNLLVVSTTFCFILPHSIVSAQCDKCSCSCVDNNIHDIVHDYLMICIHPCNRNQSLRWDPVSLSQYQKKGILDSLWNLHQESLLFCISANLSMNMYVVEIACVRESKIEGESRIQIYYCSLS